MVKKKEITHKSTLKSSYPIKNINVGNIKLNKKNIKNNIIVNKKIIPLINKPNLNKPNPIINKPNLNKPNPIINKPNLNKPNPIINKPNLNKPNRIINKLTHKKNNISSINRPTRVINKLTHNKFIIPPISKPNRVIDKKLDRRILMPLINKINKNIVFKQKNMKTFVERFSIADKHSIGGMIFRRPTFEPILPINPSEHQNGPKNPKIAIILRGGISRVNGNYKMGMNPNKCNYVNYKSCYISIMNHIVRANSNCSFDFFIHSWTTDLQEPLIKLYKPVKSLFEDNLKYKSEFENTIKNITGGSGGGGGMYIQLSQGLTIKKGIELVEEHVKTTGVKYDLAIVYRPDVLLWKDMLLKNYFGNYIYTNRHCNVKNGDLHFVMNYDKLLKFKDLYNSANLGNKPFVHKWIEDYINNYIYETPFYDNIQVEKDQDVLRKIYGSSFIHDFITVKQLLNYGLTEEKIKKYVNRLP
jgi:hypothetical protein